MNNTLALALLPLLLAASAAASLSGQPAESRWNLLDILPRSPNRSAAPVADEGLDEADAARARGEHDDAILGYRLFLARCPEKAACAVHLDRARSGLGRSLAASTPPDGGDGPTPRESVRWLESVADVELRVQGEPDLQRMRALIAAKGRPASPERLPSLQSAVTGATASGGAAFDGASRDRAPLSVSLSLRDGKPNEVAVSAGDWNIAVGQLGIGDRSPILSESPYINLRRVTRSSLDSAIDRRLELQAGVIDIHSRFFGDDSSNAALGRLSGLARRLGLPENVLAPLDRFTVNDPIRSELGVLAGVLAQFGRATSLPFPVGSPVAADAAWSATALLKTSGYVPTAAANASAGVRVTLPSGHQGALIGGWTEEVLPVSPGLLSALARGSENVLDLHRAGSPQASAVVSGPIPGTVVDFELGASQRWSSTVVEQKLQAGLNFDVVGKPVQARVSYRDERGKSIEYGRNGLAVEASLTFAPGSSIYALCEKEKVSYGGVDISNDGCLTGVRWTPHSAVTVNADMIFGGRDSVSDEGSAAAAALAASIGRLGAAGLEVSDLVASKLDPWEGLNAALEVVANLPPSDVEAALEAIADSPLPPQTKELLAGMLSRAAGGVPSASADEIRRLIEKELGPIPDLRKEYAGRRSLAVEAIALLSDPGFWDGAARSVVRSQIIAAASGVKLSLGPLGSLRITPASTLLMAGAARYTGSPLSPLTAQDADILFQRTALHELAKAVGAPSGADSRAVVDALINRSRDALAAELEARVITRISSHDDRLALANEVLARIPPDVASRLRERLGADLGLSGLDAGDAERLLRSLPETVARELRAHAGPAAAQALDQALALAAQSVRREVNRAVLQLMLAAEEFDRLTVDRGLKPGDLGARMLSESFKRLDERKRRGLRARREESIRRMKEAANE